jgi:phage tail sheath protein FI
MGFQLSPGVSVTEIDLTTIVPAVATTIGAIAGKFQWGPANKPQLIDSAITLISEFGNPDNETANTWFTCYNFLAYANALQTVRVIRATGEGAHKNATADGTGLLIDNEDTYLATYSMGQGDVGQFAAKYAGTPGNSVTVSMADVNSFANWQYATSFDGPPNTSTVIANGGGSNDEIHVVTVDSLGYWTGTPGQVLERFPFLSKSAVATYEDGSTIYYAEVLNRQSNYIWWMDFPSEDDLGISTAVNWGGDATVDYDTMSTKLTLTGITGTFTVGETVRDAAAVTVTPSGTGATATGTALVGGGTGVISLTVTAPGTGYLAAPTVTVVGGNGTYSSAVATVSGGGVTAINVTVTGAYTVTAPTITITSPGTGATASITVNGSGAVIAVTPTAAGTGYTAAPVVHVTGPGSGATITAVLGTGGTATEVVSYTIVAAGTGYSTISGKVISWASPELEIAPVSGSFVATDSVTGVSSSAAGTVSVVAGGALTIPLSGGVDGNAAILDGDIINGYTYFQSAEDIDITLLLAADNDSTVTTFLINDIAESRLDCVTFMSPPLETVLNNAGNEATDIIAYANTLPDSSYAFMDSGWKYQYDQYNDIYRWVPLNGDIAGLCARTDKTNAPWWSPAGYNRGNIQNVVRLAWNPRQAYRDLLYQSSVNPVITSPGLGTVLFGDKTFLAKPSAFDRINVRRLFITLEKAIATAAKFTLFEFNDQFTQASFVSMVEPYLRQVEGQRGIYDFRVVCDSTNNTPTVIDANQFVGDIYIKPARSINFIQLNFVAVRTGVDFSEVVGTFD